MKRELVTKVRKEKEESIKVFMLKQMALAGFISGLIGLVLGEFYTIMLNNFVWQVANCFLYIIIGIAIGYFTSKPKKKELKIEIMMLKKLEEKLLQ